MYYDIYITDPSATYEDTADGVVVTLPGDVKATVYAVSQRDSTGLHCLVTEAQLDKIDAGKFVYSKYPDIALSLKYANGSPSHVFNPAGITYRDTDKKWLHRVRAISAEEIDAAPKVVLLETLRER